MSDQQLALAAALFLLFLLDALTVAARTGLLNLSLARLLAYRERREKDVNRVLALTRSLRRLRASLTLAHAIWRFLGAGLVLVLLVPSVQTPLDALEAAGILLLAALAAFWVEWLVRSAVLRSAEPWAMRLAVFARVLTVVLYPLLVLPLAISRGRGDDEEPGGAVTEDDLKTLVDAGQQEGVLEQDERQMIYSIFQLGDTLAREIMVPRIDMLALDVGTPLPQAVDALVKAGHSRVPVYEESVDNILGVLYARDLLQVWREGKQDRSLRDLLRPACFVPEAKKVDELMAEMQENRIHMAVVVDEYGGVAGLVTLEDIVEEIVGEIQDEYDQAEESPYQSVGDGEYILQGRVDLGEFNEVMGSHLPQDEAETLGGFIYSRMGRVPASGDSLRVGELLLTVEQVIGRRIRKVRACRVPPAQESD